MSEQQQSASERFLGELATVVGYSIPIWIGMNVVAWIFGVWAPGIAFILAVLIAVYAVPYLLIAAFTDILKR